LCISPAAGTRAGAQRAARGQLPRPPTAWSTPSRKDVRAADASPAGRARLPPRRPPPGKRLGSPAGGSLGGNPATHE